MDKLISKEVNKNESDEISDTNDNKDENTVKHNLKSTFDINKFQFYNNINFITKFSSLKIATKILSVTLLLSNYFLKSLFSI